MHQLKRISIFFLHFSVIFFLLSLSYLNPLNTSYKIAEGKKGYTSIEIVTWNKFTEWKKNLNYYYIYFDFHLLFLTSFVCDLQACTTCIDLYNTSDLYDTLTTSAYDTVSTVLLQCGLFLSLVSLVLYPHVWPCHAPIYCHVSVKFAWVHEWTCGTHHLLK